MQDLTHWSVCDDKLFYQEAGQQTEQIAENIVTLISNDGSFHVVDISRGADRIQVVFRHHNIDFMLQGEMLCEAVWIEHVNQRDIDPDSLQKLKNSLHRIS